MEQGLDSRFYSEEKTNFIWCLCMCHQWYLSSYLGSGTLVLWSFQKLNSYSFWFFNIQFFGTSWSISWQNWATFNNSFGLGQHLYRGYGKYSYFWQYQSSTTMVTFLHWLCVFGSFDLCHHSLWNSTQILLCKDKVFGQSWHYVHALILHYLCC